MRARLYAVTIDRQVTERAVVRVKARSRDRAEELAEDMADDADWEPRSTGPLTIVEVEEDGEE